MAVVTLIVNSSGHQNSVETNYELVEQMGPAEPITIATEPAATTEVDSLTEISDLQQRYDAQRSLVTSLNAKRAKLKKDIKQWVDAFVSEHGVQPGTEQKESIRHMYEAYAQQLTEKQEAEEALAALKAQLESHPNYSSSTMSAASGGTDEPGHMVSIFCSLPLNSRCLSLRAMLSQAPKPDSTTLTEVDNHLLVQPLEISASAEPAVLDISMQTATQTDDHVVVSVDAHAREAVVDLKSAPSSVSNHVWAASNDGADDALPQETVTATSTAGAIVVCNDDGDEERQTTSMVHETVEICIGETKQTPCSVPLVEVAAVVETVVQPEGAEESTCDVSQDATLSETQVTISAQQDGGESIGVTSDVLKIAAANAVLVDTPSSTVPVEAVDEAPIAFEYPFKETSDPRSQEKIVMLSLSSETGSTEVGSREIESLEQAHANVSTDCPGTEELTGSNPISTDNAVSSPSEDIAERVANISVVEDSVVPSSTLSIQDDAVRITDIAAASTHLVQNVGEEDCVKPTISIHFDGQEESNPTINKPIGDEIVVGNAEGVSEVVLAGEATDDNAINRTTGLEKLEPAESLSENIAVASAVVQQEDSFNEINLSTATSSVAEIEAAMESMRLQRNKTKRAIRDWIDSFTETNGRPPTSEDKESVRHLYVAHVKVSKALDRLVDKLDALRPTQSDTDGSQRPALRRRYSTRRECKRNVVFLSYGFNPISLSIC